MHCLLFTQIFWILKKYFVVMSLIILKFKQPYCTSSFRTLESKSNLKCYPKSSHSISVFPLGINPHVYLISWQTIPCKYWLNLFKLFLVHFNASKMLFMKDLWTDIITRFNINENNIQASLSHTLTVITRSNSTDWSSASTAI